MQISHLPLAFLVRPLLRTRLFEFIGGRPVEENNLLIDYGRAQVQERQSKGKNVQEDHQENLLSKLVGAEDRKTGWRPSASDLDTESLNMMLAGADPYSGVLAGCFFYLVHNLTCTQKLTKEIRQVVPVKGIPNSLADAV